MYQENMPSPDVNQESKIDFEKSALLPSGVKVLNCTPHSVTFRSGENDMIVEPSGAKLQALPVEEAVGEIGQARIVKTVFNPTESGLKELEEIEKRDPDLKVIGSLVSAQAYPGRVFSMAPAPGFERVPVDQKRMDPFKFTVFNEDGI